MTRGEGGGSNSEIISSVTRSENGQNGESSRPEVERNWTKDSVTGSNPIKVKRDERVGGERSKKRRITGDVFYELSLTYPGACLFFI